MADGSDLQKVLDAPLRALFHQQLRILSARAADRYEAMMAVRPSPVEVRRVAEAEFVEGAKVLVRPGGDWSYEAELQDMLARIANSSSQDMQLVREITMSAMDGSEPVFAAAWANSNGSSATYNNDTMLVGHYANTLLHKSFEFGKFIRHGSSKNLFDSLMSDKVTLGVAAYDKSTGHLMDTVATNHPFKKILMLTHYPTPNVTETIPAPGDNVSLTTQEASSEPYMHLCEVAELVTTDWFALTDNYHIINAPVSVLMDGEMPMLPYVTSESKYCGERPNCKASLDQATSLFGVELTCTSVRLG